MRSIVSILSCTLTYIDAFTIYIYATIKKFKVQGGLNFEPEAWNRGGFAP